MNDILYIFLFTSCYISIIPFTSIFHAITIFTNHIVHYINELCYFINRHPGLYPFLHTINIIHLVFLRFNDVPRIHVFICPTIHCYKGMSITFDDTCMRIPILNGTMFYFVIIFYIPFLFQLIVYIYYRFIVHFPIGLDFLFITFTILLHLLLSWTTGQVGLGVGSWPSNRATEGSNPKGTRLYFVILLKNEEKIFDWH